MNHERVGARLDYKGVDQFLPIFGDGGGGCADVPGYLSVGLGLCARLGQGDLDGLGNIGAKAAIPVMEGKAALLKAFANIDGFPICLDTQDSDEIIDAVIKIAPV